MLGELVGISKMDHCSYFTCFTYLFSVVSLFRALLDCFDQFC
ncbi:hypothetical protein Hanom_Chr05g00391801 [Helianthus anomalus]